MTLLENPDLPDTDKIVLARLIASLKQAGEFDGAATHCLRKIARIRREVDASVQASDKPVTPDATPALQQITKSQDVDPSFDIHSIKDGWPEGEDVEAFIAEVDAARHQPDAELVRLATALVDGRMCVNEYRCGVHADFYAKLMSLRAYLATLKETSGP